MKLTKSQVKSLPPKQKPYAYAKDLGVINKGPILSRPRAPLEDPFSGGPGMAASIAAGVARSK